MYGSEALRQLRERQANRQEPERQASLLEQIPPDAPMDDATICAWDGERFVGYDLWRAKVKVEADPEPPDPLAALADATVVAATCGGTRLWLVRDGERWFLYVGTKKGSGRRRDFASPYLAHAIRTAEQWYGAAEVWRPDKRNDDRTTASTPDLYSAGAGGGHGDVGLDGR
jgi:hypothetical protein